MEANGGVNNGLGEGASSNSNNANGGGGGFGGVGFVQVKPETETCSIADFGAEVGDGGGGGEDLGADGDGDPLQQSLDGLMMNCTSGSDNCFSDIMNMCSSDGDEILANLLKEGMFTQDDLFSVTGDIPDLGVTEADSASPAFCEITSSCSRQGQANTFIPLNSSDIKQIQGSDIRTGPPPETDIFSSAQNQSPYLRLMVTGNGKMEDTKGGGFPGGSKLTENASGNVQISGGGGAHGTQVNEVRISNTNPKRKAPCRKRAAAEEGARKPRGRKPKNSVGPPNTAVNVPNGNNGSNMSRTEIQKNSDCVIPPNIVVQHTAANYLPQNPNHNNLLYSVPIPQQQQHIFPTSGPGRIYSMEHLASEDRNAAIARRSGSDSGVEITPVPGLGRSFPSNAIDSSQNQKSQNGGTDENGLLRRGNGNGDQNQGMSFNLPGNNNQKLNDGQAGAKMDQLFTNRILSASTPRRSTVKASFIHQNRHLYNQLTTPTEMKQSNFGMGTLTQDKDKWMQFPNPSVAPTGSASTNIGTGRYQILENPACKPAEPPPLGNASYGPGGNGQQYHSNGNRGSVMGPGLGLVTAGVQNGGINSTFNGGSTGASCSNYHMNPNGYSNNNALSHGGPHSSMPLFNMNNGMNNSTDQNVQNEMRDLKNRMESLYLDNCELKSRNYWLAKSNKQLIMRLRAASQQSEALKANAHDLYVQLSMKRSMSLFRTVPSSSTPFMEDILQGINEPTGNGARNESANSVSEPDTETYTVTRVKQEMVEEANPVDNEGGNQSSESTLDCLENELTVTGLKRETDRQTDSADSNKRPCTDVSSAN